MTDKIRDDAFHLMEQFKNEFNHAPNSYEIAVFIIKKHEFDNMELRKQNDIIKETVKFLKETIDAQDQRWEKLKKYSHDYCLKRSRCGLIFLKMQEFESGGKKKKEGEKMKDGEYQKLCGEWHYCKCLAEDTKGGGMRVVPLSRFKKLEANIIKAQSQNAYEHGRAESAHEQMIKLDKKNTELNRVIDEISKQSGNVRMELTEQEIRWEKHIKWLQDRIDCSMDAKFILKHIKELESYSVVKT